MNCAVVSVLSVVFCFVFFLLEWSVPWYNLSLLVFVFIFNGERKLMLCPVTVKMLSLVVYVLCLSCMWQRIMQNNNKKRYKLKIVLTKKNLTRHQAWCGGPLTLMRLDCAIMCGSFLRFVLHLSCHGFHVTGCALCLSCVAFHWCMQLSNEGFHSDFEGTLFQCSGLPVCWGVCWPLRQVWHGDHAVLVSCDWCNIRKNKMRDSRDGRWQSQRPTLVESGLSVTLRWQSILTGDSYDVKSVVKEI